jgi:hypothetical protein
MQSGPPICRLAARARPTSGSACSGWPTPSAREFEHADLDNLMERRERIKAQGINGNGFGLTLGMFDLIPCRDGKARRVEPGTFPLAHGVPGRVGLLRGYGNAIVPEVGALFVAAYLEGRPASSTRWGPPPSGVLPDGRTVCRREVRRAGYSVAETTYVDFRVKQPKNGRAGP